MQYLPPQVLLSIKELSKPLLKPLKEEKSATSSDQLEEDHLLKVPQSPNQNPPKLKPHKNNKRKKKPHHHHQLKNKKEWIWEDFSIDLSSNYLNLSNNLFNILSFTLSPKYFFIFSINNSIFNNLYKI